MITLTQGLLNLNPAFNDAIIEFESDTLANPIKANITVDGVPFVIYPYPSNGRFKFNLVDIAKSLFTGNNFRDGIIPNTATDFIYYDDNIVKSKSALVTILNSASTESQTFNFDFYRGVEQQIGYTRKSEMANESDVRVMLPTTNYIDYTVTYFEGFPFDFAVHGLEIDDEIYFRNPQTTFSSDTYTISDSGTTRFYLSDGANEITFDDTLLLNSALNRVELWVNGSFKSNITIHRKESECGVYLRFLNNEGAYSYWRFSQVFKQSFSTKDLASIAGDYANLQSIYSSTYLIGKTAKSSMAVETIFDHEFMPYFKSLLASPQVEMYNYFQPFNQVHADYDWIKVNVNDGQFQVLDSKANLTKISLSIDLPPINTITL